MFVNCYTILCVYGESTPHEVYLCIVGYIQELGEKVSILEGCVFLCDLEHCEVSRDVVESAVCYWILCIVL